MRSCLSLLCILCFALLVNGGNLNKKIDRLVKGNIVWLNTKTWDPTAGAGMHPFIILNNDGKNIRGVHLTHKPLKGQQVIFTDTVAPSLAISQSPDRPDRPDRPVPQGPSQIVVDPHVISIKKIKHWDIGRIKKVPEQEFKNIENMMATLSGSKAAGNHEEHAAQQGMQKNDAHTAMAQGAQNQKGKKRREGSPSSQSAQPAAKKAKVSRDIYLAYYN